MEEVHRDTCFGIFAGSRVPRSLSPFLPTGRVAIESGTSHSVLSLNVDIRNLTYTLNARPRSAFHKAMSSLDGSQQTAARACLKVLCDRDIYLVEKVLYGTPSITLTATGLGVGISDVVNWEGEAGKTQRGNPVDLTDPKTSVGLLAWTSRAIDILGDACPHNCALDLSDPGSRPLNSPFRFSCSDFQPGSTVRIGVDTKAIVKADGLDEDADVLVGISSEWTGGPSSTMRGNTDG